MGPFKSDDRKDKPRPDFSNVKSGSSSTAPGAKPDAQPATGRIYVVKKGDSLSRIAEREYGDPMQWRQIYDANRDTIGSDPDLIHPGQSLRIP